MKKASTSYPRTLSYALSGFALLLASYYSHAQPTAFEAHYDAQIKGFAVSATRSLTLLDNGQYQLSFSASSWAAKLNEVSTFNWQDQQLISANYQYKQSAFGKKKQREIAFNWPEQQATLTDKDKQQTLALKKQAFDPLNYQLQLQHDIANGKEKLRYELIRKGALRHYQFERLGEEVIETKLGKLNTVKVKVIRDNPDKITYLWFAKDWNYLLAQLEQFQGEKKTLSIVLRKGQVNQQTLAGL